MNQSRDNPDAAHSSTVSLTPLARPSHVRYGVVSFLCVLAFLTYFDRVCIMRAQVDIQRDLHINDDQMGWIMGIFWLAYALFEIPSGWLGDRYGARGTLTRVVLAWSFFTALSGSATGFLSLLMFRFMFGAGEAGAFPNMARIQGAWLAPKARARAGGFLWLCARWGGAFSPFLFGKLIQLFTSGAFHNATANTVLQGVAPWRLGFFTSGIIGLFWVATFWLWFRDNPADKKSVNAAELKLIRADRSPADLAAHHRAPPGTMAALFRSKTLWLISIVYVCGSFGWSFFVSWIPRYFLDRHQVNIKQSEFMTGLPLFCGGISCLIGGLLSDYLVKRTGRRRLFRAVFPICGDFTAACAMVGIVFVAPGHPTQATILFCIAAAGHDFGQPINWASIVDVGGRFAGTAFGFINMVGNIGNTIQPPIGRLIFGNFGWNALFLTYAAVFATASFTWFFINPNRRFYPESEEESRRGFEVAVDR
jgi:ACS family glucarate transporter-like MFS transporter